MHVRQFTPFEEKIWLCSPTMHGEELTYMTEAYDTNWMSTVGYNIKETERLTAETTGCKYAVALSSGTAALHLAMKLAGVKPGDHVLCSDLTFNATVNPVVYEGGVPVFIDADYETWNMDPVALEKAFELYPDAKVVVVADLYGTPAKMEEIQEVCDQHDAVLIEDAAESLGASYKGKPSGSFGCYNCISFNGNKIITGSAGGCLVTDDKEAAEKAKKWSTQSREDAPWYQHEKLGYNYRMSNVIAGVVRGQFAHLEEHIARKKEIYERYEDGFKDLPVSMNPLNLKDCEPNYWLSCMLINPASMCEQIRGDLEASYIPEHGKTCPTEILETLAKYNVEGRPIWKPMHMQPLFQENGFVTCESGKQTEEDVYNGSSSGVDADIFNRGLCMPSDIKMTAEEQDKVIEIVRSCFD